MRSLHIFHWQPQNPPRSATHRSGRHNGGEVTDPGRSEGPSLHRHYPVSSVLRPSPTPARSHRAKRDVWSCLRPNGSPSVRKMSSQRAVPSTPADRNRCTCRLLPCSVRPSPFDSRVGIRDSATSRDTEIISRPAQASRVLRPAGSLGSPRPPLSRGFGVASCPPTPPASFQVNRQLPVWNLPPLTLHAFEAHYQVDCPSSPCSSCVG